jgi:hypothetical protein
MGTKGPNRLYYTIQDLPFDLIIRAHARHIFNNTTVEGSISTVLAINTYQKGHRQSQQVFNLLTQSA